MKAMSNAVFLLICLALTEGKGLGKGHRQHHQSVLDKSERKTDLDFVSTRVSALGELETRLSYGGITAMEVVIPYEGEQGLFYRQITEGRRIVQSIYVGKENLVDCDISADEDDLERFYARFYGDSEVFVDNVAKSVEGNISMRIITGDLDAQLKTLSDFKGQRRQCNAFTKQLQKTKGPKEPRNGLFDTNQVQQAADEHHRSKRSMFIYPGTKWCGRGSVSTHFDDLGDNIATDKCCREHDHCPFTIEGFTTNFGLFNYRFHTLSHCNCDESFRSCLRRARNEVANMVGELYFNVVGTKCFTLKKQRECVQRSWWGKCKEYDTTQLAAIKEPLIY